MSWPLGAAVVEISEHLLTGKPIVTFWFYVFGTEYWG